MRFGDRRCCASRATVACCWFALIGPHAFAQPWITLLTMSITGPCQQEQEYGYLSYLHHVVLGLDEIDRLVHTITEFGTHGRTTLSFLSSFCPQGQTLPEFVAWSGLSSILVRRSLCQALSAERT